MDCLLSLQQLHSDWLFDLPCDKLDSKSLQLTWLLFNGEEPLVTLARARDISALFAMTLKQHHHGVAAHRRTIHSVLTAL